MSGNSNKKIFGLWLFSNSEAKIGFSFLEFDVFSVFTCSDSNVFSKSLELSVDLTEKQKKLFRILKSILLQKKHKSQVLWPTNVFA